MDGRIILKWIFKDVGCDDEGWVQLAQDRGQWSALEKTVIKILLKTGNYLNIWGINIFSRRTLLHRDKLILEENCLFLYLLNINHRERTIHIKVVDPKEVVLLLNASMFKTTSFLEHFISCRGDRHGPKWIPRLCTDGLFISCEGLPIIWSQTGGKGEVVPVL